MTQEQLENLQGQIDELQRQLEISNRKIEQLKMQKTRPYTDIKYYNALKVDKLYAGLVIYDTSTTTNHVQGEIYLTKIGSTTTLKTFIDGSQVNL